MDYDRILVLGAGRVLELGSPQELLANPHGHLSKMVADSNKAQKNDK
jgi:ABC-type multidrug transport system fused ATPase/permease subunit